MLLLLDLTFANGYRIGPIGTDSFDAGITLDVLLIGIQAILTAGSLRAFLRARAPAVRPAPTLARREAV